MLAAQMIEKFSALAHLRPLLKKIENWPMYSAMHILPMCEEIADEARKCNQQVTVLKDVSLLHDKDDQASIEPGFPLHIQSPVFMYIGNLEHYQGIDLLLQSSALALQKQPSLSVVIIGGRDQHITRYKQLARDLGIENHVFFLGPKPVSRLASLMARSDVLVSPRSKGGNTPMKIYTYMDSGRPVLATNLATHTQVLSASNARLADATPEAFADAMLQLAGDPDLRNQLADAARTYVRREHSFERFKTVLNGVYEQLGREQQDATG